MVLQAEASFSDKLNFGWRYQMPLKWALSIDLLFDNQMMDHGSPASRAVMIFCCCFFADGTSWAFHFFADDTSWAFHSISPLEMFLC